ISFGATGSGWVGVYKWCHQAAARGNGRLRTDALVFENYDLVILHLDADVAGANYGQGSIQPLSTDGPLPCEHLRASITSQRIGSCWPWQPRFGTGRNNVRDSVLLGIGLRASCTSSPRLANDCILQGHESILSIVPHDTSATCDVII